MTFDPITLFAVLDDCNPENVIAAPEGTYLYRDGNVFSKIEPSSSIPKRIEVSKKALAYRLVNQPWFSKIEEFRLTYAHTKEIWFKETSGDKTGWKFISFDKALF